MAWATIKMSRYASRCHFRTRQPLELDKRVEMDTVDRRKSTYIERESVELFLSFSFVSFSPPFSVFASFFKLAVIRRVVNHGTIVRRFIENR